MVMRLKRITYVKIFANILLCFIMMVLFSTNSIIRPLTTGAIYKEYIVGGIVMGLFYSNIFIFYSKFYLRGGISKYLLISLFCILVAVGLELIIVYPQIVKDYLGGYDKLYVVQYLVLYFIMLFLRDLAFYFVSFGICNVIRQYRLNRIYERHLKEVKDEILVEKDFVKDNYSDKRFDSANVEKTQVLPDKEGQCYTESAKQESISSSPFTTISNILYLEQFKNNTLVHTIEEGLCLRNSTLKKTMTIIGTDNMFLVNKSIAIMKKYLYSFDNFHVKLKNPNNNSIVTIKWSPNYYNRAIPILREMEFKNKDSDSIMMEALHSQQNLTPWNIPDVLRNDKANQIYFYISQHAGCKLFEISQLLKIPIATLNRILKQLKADGLITYEGSKKTGGYRAVSS